MTDDIKFDEDLKYVEGLMKFLGEKEGRKRSLVSDALKRHGIEAKPDDREVNCLSGRRFEEDMQDDKNDKAKELGAQFNDPWPVEFGYLRGHEDGYWAARKEMEEKWPQVYWSGFKAGRRSAGLKEEE